VVARREHGSIPESENGRREHSCIRGSKCAAASAAGSPDPGTRDASTDPSPGEDAAASKASSPDRRTEARAPLHPAIRGHVSRARPHPWNHGRGAGAAPSRIRKRGPRAQLRLLRRGRVTRDALHSGSKDACREHGRIRDPRMPAASGAASPGEGARRGSDHAGIRRKRTPFLTSAAPERGFLRRMRRTAKRSRAEPRSRPLTGSGRASQRPTPRRPRPPTAARRPGRRSRGRRGS
jgi:hypothetical protein